MAKQDNTVLVVIRSVEFVFRAVFLLGLFLVLGPITVRFLSASKSETDLNVTVQRAVQDAENRLHAQLLANDQRFYEVSLREIVKADDSLISRINELPVIRLLERLDSATRVSAISTNTYGKALSILTNRPSVFEPIFGVGQLKFPKVDGSDSNALKLVADHLSKINKAVTNLQTAASKNIVSAPEWLKGENREALAEYFASVALSPIGTQEPSIQAALLASAGVLGAEQRTYERPRISVISEEPYRLLSSDEVNDYKPRGRPLYWSIGGFGGGSSHGTVELLWTNQCIQLFARPSVSHAPLHVASMRRGDMMSLATQTNYINELFGLDDKAWEEFCDGRGASVQGPRISATMGPLDYELKHERLLRPTIDNGPKWTNSPIFYFAKGELAVADVYVLRFVWNSANKFAAISEIRKVSPSK